MRLTDVIEWRPTDPTALVGRVPEQGPADIRFGAQLIVRESQCAIFYRDGQCMDTFGPGRHTLSTANLPVVSGFLSRLTGGGNVFSAEVYFVNQGVQPEMKWGTPNPIDLKDPDLGWVSIRAFGTMSVRVDDPQLFVNTIVANQGTYSSATLNRMLKSSVQARLADLLTTNFKSYATIRSNQDELAAAMKLKVKDDFGKYGIGLRDFFISDISVPEEVQAAFRRRTAMGALGVNSYSEMQTADAMLAAANNQGTGGGAMQLGLAMMMPQMMMNMQHQQQMQQSMQQVAAPAPQPMVTCANCRTQVPAGTKFCNNCGSKIVPPAPAGSFPCAQCGAMLPAGTKFCPECGTKVQAPQPTVCSNCNAEVAPGAKFCNNCGNKVG